MDEYLYRFLWEFIFQSYEGEYFKDHRTSSVNTHRSVVVGHPGLNPNTFDKQAANWHKPHHVTDPRLNITRQLLLRDNQPCLKWKLRAEPSAHLASDNMAVILADGIFKWILLNENGKIPIQISLKFVPMSLIDYMQVLVQVMAWRRTGDKPLPELMMTQFTDAYVRH